jgi:hypothetical protein
MRNVGSAYRWGVPIAVAALLAWLVVDCARGQGIGQLAFEAGGHGGVMAWATSSHGYQHAMRGRANLTATWELAENLHVVARAKLSLKRWGTSDAFIKHALLSAETARVYSRRQGASLGVRYRWVEVGAELDRRSVHQVWRHKGREPRHNYFPGSWRVGRSGHAPSYETDPIFPSLGYWDGARPYLRISHQGVRLVLRGPLLRWKSLTLPWPAIRARAAYRWDDWHLRIDMQGLRHRAWTGTMRVERHVVGALWLRGSGGWAHPPQWRDVKLRRIAFGLILKTE